MFVTGLKMLAASCEFENFTSQLIRDQLIARCNSKKIQERLLTCKDPTLEKAIDIAKNIETSDKDLEQLEVAASNTTTSSAVPSKSGRSHSQVPIKRKESSEY